MRKTFGNKQIKIYLVQLWSEIYLVQLWSEVVHPVANDPLPDELALPFKPDLLLLV